MNDAKKAQYKAEIAGIRAMVMAAAPAMHQSQTTFVAGTSVVNIPALSVFAQAFKHQIDCIDKLAKLVEKVIDES